MQQLEAANARFASQFPGDPVGRQPVHTVYGGAHLFKAEIVESVGRVALRTFNEYTGDPDAFAECFGMEPALAERVCRRVEAKLRNEPIEDYRIDFEDGYGYRPWDEEDAEATRSAREFARGLTLDRFPPFAGFRIKPLTEAARARAERTLDVFLRALGETSRTILVTLPKVTIPEQVDALAGMLEPYGDRFAIELMIETPQSLFAIPQLVAAGRGRVTGLHFGAYDYTSTVNIAASRQTLRHPACTFARQMMQAGASGLGVTLSDGATTIMPVGSDRSAVRHALKLHFDNVQAALDAGFYQGWDLHPGQLPARYAAVYAFFWEGFDAAGARLRNFVDRAARATLVGNVFDDAATGQGLLNFFLRGVNCGAFTEAEAAEATGLTLDELRSRSFVAILNRRRVD